MFLRVCRSYRGTSPVINPSFLPSFLTGPILAESRAPHSSSLDLLVVTLVRIPTCITANKNDVLYTVIFSSVFKIEDALCSQQKNTPMEKVGVYMVHVGEGARRDTYSGGDM